MRSLCLSAVYLLFFYNTFAQQSSISGNVFSEKQPLAGAIVKLSNTIYATATDSMGSYVIQNIPNGKYDLVITFLGFNDLKKSVEIKGSSINLGKLEMTSSEKRLSEISVSGQLKRGKMSFTHTR